MTDISPKTYCAITHYVKSILRKFDRETLPYCVLRNYEFLTEGQPYDNSDLDLLVRSRDLARIHTILMDGGFVRTQQSTVRLHLGYAAYVAGAGRVLSLDLHLDDPSWNDVPYVAGNHILRESIGSEPPIPCDAHTAALLVFHSILDKKSFKRKYIDILESLLRSDLDLCKVKSIFEDRVGKPLALDLTNGLKDRD